MAASQHNLPDTSSCTPVAIKLAEIEKSERCIVCSCSVCIRAPTWSITNGLLLAAKPMVLRTSDGCGFSGGRAKGRHSIASSWIRGNDGAFKGDADTTALVPARWRSSRSNVSQRFVGRGGVMRLDRLR